ncbi:signal peptidase I [Spinactinospora alkalitolerans]|uniref:Signal peptidase I n=1 Tax=Spinactinospora alkalitolerans TaxID=687207 RepID=A0A852TRK7_9ACTN|nr:signal peptidase I [Spinactinospora alkalitolerans]NYE45927.1 signal peptidase I [Spinactinospora alkalitolerans]
MNNDDLDPRDTEIRDTDDGAVQPDPNGASEDSGSPASTRGGASAVSEAAAKHDDTGGGRSGSPPDESGSETSAAADEPAGTGEGPDATMSAKKQGKGEEKAGSFWKELPILIVIALVLAFVIRTWVVQPFYIPSSSMEDTLLIGDRVFVNKLVYEVRDIKRGDIVVFNGSGSWDEEDDVTVEEPTNPVSRLFTWVGQQFGMAPTGKDYIKRVIGLPGDTVQCCDEQNRVLVNGVPLNEDYLYPGSLETHQEFGPVEVPEGRLWVMGDHRAVSYDSRMHQSDPGGGTISEESVVGRAFVIVWPLGRMDTLPIPDTFTGLNEGTAEAAAAGVPFALGAAAAVPVHLAGRRARRGARPVRRRGR